MVTGIHSHSCYTTHPKAIEVFKNTLNDSNGECGNAKTFSWKISQVTIILQYVDTELGIPFEGKYLCSEYPPTTHRFYCEFSSVVDVQNCM
jgi:hypothetical protein